MDIDDVFMVKILPGFDLLHEAFSCCLIELDRYFQGNTLAGHSVLCTEYPGDTPHSDQFRIGVFLEKLIRKCCGSGLTGPGRDEGCVGAGIGKWFCC